MQPSTAECPQMYVFLFQRSLSKMSKMRCPACMSEDAANSLYMYTLTAGRYKTPCITCIGITNDEYASLYENLAQLPHSNGLQCHGAFTVLLCVIIYATVAEDITRWKSCCVGQCTSTQRAYTILRVTNADTLRMRWKHLRWRYGRAEGRYSQRTSRRRR